MVEINLKQVYFLAILQCQIDYVRFAHGTQIYKFSIVSKGNFLSPLSYYKRKLFFMTVSSALEVSFLFII